MPSSQTLHRPAAASRLGPVERWFIPALLLTVGLHLGIYQLLHVTPFTGFSPKNFQLPVKRAFKVTQAQIDPRALDNKREQTEKVPTKPVPDVTALQIPGEAKPSYEQMMEKAETVIAAPEGPKTMSQEKPQVETSKTLDRLLADNSPQHLPSDIKALTEQLLAGKPVVTGSHPSFDVNGETMSRPNVGPNAGAPNFSNLESLLSNKGPLSSKTAPILLPTDLLFDYDSAVLRDGAVGSLEKLAELIQRNPASDFTIEGHTDNFGTPEYNMQLSLARAVSVKQWLAGAAGINPARIQTRGLGMSRLLVQGGDVDAQQLNRRVEIVIHNHRSGR